MKVCFTFFIYGNFFITFITDSAADRGDNLTFFLKFQRIYSINFFFKYVYILKQNILYFPKIAYIGPLQIDVRLRKFPGDFSISRIQKSTTNSFGICRTPIDLTLFEFLFVNRAKFNPD